MPQINVDFCALIMAAGSSTRMRGTEKQFISLGGKTVLLRSMEAFEKCEFVNKIIVVTRREYLKKVTAEAKCGGISKFDRAVEGAASRTESVKAGIDAIGGSKYVLIHDCARPLVTAEVIADVAKAAEQHSAAICGVGVKDTVKIIGTDSFVQSTVDRDRLICVQTPQGFNVDLFRKVLFDAGDLSRFTDDASVMEAARQQVYVVPGDYRNIKITTPEDIVLAKSYLDGEIK